MRPMSLTCCLLGLATILWLGSPRSTRAAEVVRGLWIINRDGTGLKRLTTEPLPGLTNCGTPDWSPDGTRIVCDATPDRAWSQSHIVVIHFVGPRAGEVDDLGLGVQPTWSPDGETIAFYLNPGSIPGAPSGMWRMDAEGHGRKHLGSHVQPRWTPSGAWLISTEAFSASRRLRLVDPDSGESPATIAVPEVEFLYKPSFIEEATMVSAIKLRGEPVLGILT